jgi:hypothetical protein
MIHAQGYDIDRFEDEIEEIGEHLQQQMGEADD